MDPQQLAGPKGDPSTLIGTVMRRGVAQGSKQAHSAPVLVLDDGRWARLFIEGDNPFENTALAALLGRRVAIEGQWREMVLRVPPTGIAVFPACESEEVSAPEEEDRGVVTGAKVLPVGEE